MKTYREVLDESKKTTLADIVKILKSEDFGMTEAGGNGEALIQNGNLVIRDSYYARGAIKLPQMVDEWTVDGGTNHDYFLKEYKVKFALVKSHNYINDGKMYGKKSSMGVLEIHLKIVE